MKGMKTDNCWPTYRFWHRFDFSRLHFVNNIRGNRRVVSVAVDL
jgi:hypothetical protein